MRIFRFPPLTAVQRRASVDAFSTLGGAVLTEVRIANLPKSQREPWLRTLLTIRMLPEVGQ